MQCPHRVMSGGPVVTVTLIYPAKVFPPVGLLLLSCILISIIFEFYCSLLLQLSCEVKISSDRPTFHTSNLLPEIILLLLLRVRCGSFIEGCWWRIFPVPLSWLLFVLLSSTFVLRKDILVGGYFGLLFHCHLFPSSLSRCQQFLPLSTCRFSLAAFNGLSLVFWRIHFNAKVWVSVHLSYWRFTGLLESTF